MLPSSTPDSAPGNAAASGLHGAATNAPTPAHDTLPCGWLRIDARGEVQAVNQALCDWLGAPRQTLLMQPLDQLLTPASRVLYQSHVQPLLKLHGSVDEFSLTLQFQSGPHVDGLLYAKAQPGTDPPAFELVLVRIRQRRRIEDEMLRIKRAADLAPGLIFQMMQAPDGSKRFPYTSEAIRRLYGVTAEDAAKNASAIFDRIDPQDRAAIREQLDLAAATLTDWRAGYRVRLPDGALRWHEVHATPRQLAGHVILWHGHVADITERKEVELALAARESLERSHRLRNEFLARVSHELRTPLNGILGFAQLLATDHADNLRPDQTDRIDVIRSSGSILLHLINEVLDISSLEAARTTIEVGPMPLRPCLDAAMRAVALQAQDAGITLLPVNCPPALRVQGNEQRLQQVLSNLLTNAIKYNHPQGSVDLTVEADASTVRIAVRDTGRGLTAEQRAGLFQPFNRLGAERSNIAGTGLGLVITQNLVQLMGGRMEVRSEPGRGATFTACLPAAHAHNPNPSSLAESPAHAPTQPAAPKGYNGPAPLPPTRGVVLYVEDNEVNAVLMQAIAGMRPGVQLHVATDGASALLSAPQLRPDLLLIDLDLPDINGQTLLTQLRHIPTLQATPAVVVSATAKPALSTRASPDDFVDHWLKPLDIDQVLAALDRLLAAPLTQP